MDVALQLGSAPKMCSASLFNILSKLVRGTSLFFCMINCISYLIIRRMRTRSVLLREQISPCGVPPNGGHAVPMR